MSNNTIFKNELSLTLTPKTFFKAGLVVLDDKGKRSLGLEAGNIDNVTLS